MNMVAAHDITTAVRVDLRDLDDMPVDMVALTAASRDLSAREFRAWTMLKAHYWMYGTLPAGISALAKIGGVGAKSFEHMADALGRHFDRTDEGAWCDHRLARQRGQRLVVPSLEAPVVNQRRIDANRRNGAKGGTAKAENAARAREQLEAEARAVSAAGGLAKPLPVPGENSSDRADLASSAPEVSLEEPSRTESLSVGLLENSSEYSSRQTSEQTACAGDAQMPELAKPLANGLAKPAASDEAIVKAIVAAYDAKVDRAHVHKRLPEIRAAIAKGCSLELDIVPECREFSRGKDVIHNCFNEHVRKDAFARRSVRLKRVDPLSSNEMIKVYRDDPANAGILDAALKTMGRSRAVFFKNDAVGPYAELRKDDWDDALRKAKTGDGHDAAATTAR